MLRIQNLRRRLSTWHSTLVVVLALAGCGVGNGSPFGSLTRYGAKGKVLLADGKPLTTGRIVFLSDAPSASAAADIGGDGTFEFKGESGDGLPAATYKVHITRGPAESASNGRSGAVKPAFASKYLDEDTSGLTATVTTDESNNQFDFKLEAKNDPVSTSRGTRR
jgi:hypothetical protein